MSQEELSWLQENVLFGFADPKYGRGTAWHHDPANPESARNHFPDAVPVEAVLKRLFNWRAVETPLIMPNVRVGGTDSKPKYKDVADHTRKAIVQPLTGHVLGVHYQTYKVHDYQDWLLERVAMIIGDELQIGSAGKLRHDQLAWVSVELPESIQTAEGVSFRPRLLAVTSHDGTCSSRYSGCTIIVQCDNTLSIGMAEADGRVFRVRHTRHSDARISDAHEALGFVHTMSDEFAKEVAELTAVRVSDQQFERFINSLIPVPDDEGRAKTNAQTKHEILSSMWRDDPRVAPWRNTAWGALMATNTAEHHAYGVRGIRAERNLTKTAYGLFDRDDKRSLETLQAVLS